ncbi:trypsin theta-like, partial [Ostrinia furnacalis]
MNVLGVVFVLVSVGHASSGYKFGIGKDELDTSSIILSERVPVEPSGPGLADEYPRPQGSDRIVGGQETTIEEHPYQVSFIVNNSYFCGGFIVSEDYILTAGHCAQ